MRASPKSATLTMRKAELAASAATHKIRRYRDHEELFKDNEVDVMVLLTPPPVRAEPTIAAAEEGRHIFTEGPMARSVEEADAMAAAIRKAGVKYDCQLIDRFPRDMVLARKAVESGKLGQIGFANVELNLFQPQSYYSPTRANNWHGTWQGEGGGAVFHHGRYIIDPFLWVVGSRVVEVFAYSGPTLRVIEHDSLTQAVLRFANGATGMIHVSLISQSALEVRQNMSVGLRGRISIAGQDAHLVTQNENLRQGPDGLPPIQSRTSFVSRDAQDALEALRAEVEDLPATVPGAANTGVLGACHQRHRTPGTSRGAASPRRGGTGDLQVVGGEPTRRIASRQRRPVVQLQRTFRGRSQAFLVATSDLPGIRSTGASHDPPPSNQIPYFTSTLRPVRADS